MQFSGAPPVLGNSKGRVSLKTFTVVGLVKTWDSFYDRQHNIDHPRSTGVASRDGVRGLRLIFIGFPCNVASPWIYA